jgi:hypothetical protein
MAAWVATCSPRFVKRIADSPSSFVHCSTRPAFSSSARMASSSSAGIASDDMRRRVAAARPLPSRLTHRDPEFDAIVEELQRAGFVTIGTDAEGEETWTLTPTGEQIALQLSMSSEDDAAALLEASRG